MDIQTITTIVAAASSLGLIAVVRNLVKECKDVYNKWESINQDNKITEKELLEFAKEAMEVVKEVIKIGYIVKKLFGFAKNKKIMP
jgi:hypothetical protein